MKHIYPNFTMETLNGREYAYDLSYRNDNYVS